jgi:8-amino-7-oxononanoate synthase
MKPLQKKLSGFNKPQIAKKLGIYPFYQPIESGQDTIVYINGKKILMFGSNSYLGLTNHPRLIEASFKALKKYGTGASGSRLMNGNLDLHEELEYKLADYVKKPAATVFSTGFQANLGTISCLMGRNDYLILDDKNHASIYEGSRLSFAKTLKYKHGDMESLESVLQRIGNDHIKLIVTDGVFSMEGDIAKLDKICEIASRYEASVMVDDAHSLGVLGEFGSGTASYFNREYETDLIMGTFSKTFASLGGFIASDKDTVNFIKHSARALLFSASITPAAAATALEAINVIKEESYRIDMLWENTNYAAGCLLQEGFDIGASETPIIPIHIGSDNQTYQYFTWLFNNGVYLNPVVHPAVEKNKGILRFSLMATHSKEQIDYVVDTLIRCRAVISDFDPVYN